MARESSNLGEYFAIADFQRNYKFRVRITRSPNILSDREIPDINFFVKNWKTPDLDTQILNQDYKGVIHSIPIKDSSEKSISTSLYYTPDSTVYKYFRDWKRGVSNPNTGNMNNQRDLVGGILFEALSNDGKSVTKSVSYENIFISSLGGSEFTSDGSGFVELPMTFHFLNYTEEDFDVFN